MYIEEGPQCNGQKEKDKNYTKTEDGATLTPPKKK